MLERESVINSLERMPKQFELEDAIETLIILDNLQGAEDEIDNGEFYTHEKSFKRN